MIKLSADCLYVVEADVLVLKLFGLVSRYFLVFKLITTTENDGNDDIDNDFMR